MKHHKQILILLTCLGVGIFAFPGVAGAMKLEWSITEHYGIGENPVCAIAEDGDYIYIAGYDNSPAGSSDSQWRIQKRRKSDGSLTGGWSQVDNLNIGSVDSKRDEAYAIVVDDDPNGFVYVGGISVSTGSLNDQHAHLQKRRKSTGVKVDSYTFDIGNADSKNWITAMAIDEEYLYLKGIAVTFGRLHTEKREQADIRQRGWFVSPGSIAGWDRIEEPIIEDGDYVYMPCDQASHLVKYSKADGTEIDRYLWGGLSANTLTADDDLGGYVYIGFYDQYRGEIGVGRARKTDAQSEWYTRYQASDYSKRLGIVVDANYVYVAGTNLILKKRISDGATVSSAETGRTFNAIAQDDDFLYIAGGLAWHIEKWSKKDDFIDIGLRVYNSTISPNPIAIAALPLDQADQSPLKVCRDGDTYGIALIAPTDPDYGDAQHDSGVRIQTSAGQMALMRYQ